MKKNTNTSMRLPESASIAANGKLALALPSLWFYRLPELVATVDKKELEFSQQT